MNAPAYIEVSKYFRLGRDAAGNYHGHVIASPEAFFFVPDRHVGALAIAARRGWLGVFQVVAGRKLDKGLLDSATDLMEADFAEMPLDIRGHPDWPAKRDAGRLFVVPRPAVESLWFSFWKWGIFLRTKTLEIRIEPPLFGRGKLFEALRDMGWSI